MSAHSGCNHPATRSARAACRRAKAAGASSTARQEQVKAAATTPRKVKVVRATNGSTVTANQLIALHEIVRDDFPNCRSNTTARALLEKGLATWHGNGGTENTHYWELTEAGAEIVARVRVRG